LLGWLTVAKAKYESSGKILWSEDLPVREGKPEAVTRKQPNQQQELCI
jgi:hypothetical protein